MTWLQGGTWKLTRGNLSKLLIELLNIKKLSSVVLFNMSRINFPINIYATHTPFEVGAKGHSALILVGARHGPLVTLTLWVAFPS